MPELTDFLYTGVPRLGIVLFSAAALKHLVADGVTSDELEEVLIEGKGKAHPEDKMCGYREHAGIRLELKTFYTEGAAAVCTDGYRVK